MKIFILNVLNLTDSYHNSGSAAVIAPTVKKARILLGRGDDNEWSRARVFEVVADKPEVFIFPDAGCC